MNWPNRLSLLRILMAFVFIFLLMMQTPWTVWASLFVFIAASLTDALDGYLARRNNQVTSLGKLLDPLADKVLMTGAFVALVDLDIVGAWIVMLIISREFCVTGLRLIASTKGRILAASQWGKHKTISQFVVILGVLIWLSVLQYVNVNQIYLSDSTMDMARIIINSGMGLTLLLTLISGVVYVYENLDVLLGEE